MIGPARRDTLRFEDRGGRSRGSRGARQVPGGSAFAPVLDAAIGVARRYPLGIILLAAGLGWLAWRIRQEARPGRMRPDRVPAADEIPVLNTGQARIYDPDVSPRHPTHDLMETQREISARA